MSKEDVRKAKEQRKIDKLRNKTKAEQLRFPLWARAILPF